MRELTFSVEARAKQAAVRLTFAVRNQFQFEGVWLRGNLHCHVGGPDKIRAARDWYRDHGFDFLAATDHDAVTRFPPGGDEAFVCLHGAELSHAHVVGIGIESPPPMEPATGEGIGRLVRAVGAQGGLTILAHPHWTGWRWDDLRAAAEAGIAGFEVSNALCANINGKGRAEQLWGLLLKDGFRPAAIGSDDAHSLEQAGVGEVWTAVLAADRSATSVLQAIRAGRTYASEGPEIRAIAWDAPRAVVVDCSPCVACHFSSQGGGAKSVFADGGPSERFELNLATLGHRIRDWLYVCLEDEGGRQAWSSAMDVNCSVEKT